jgi:hypothetical protein
MFRDVVVVRRQRKFIEDLGQPIVVSDNLSAAYAEMPADKFTHAKADDLCAALAAEVAWA